MNSNVLQVFYDNKCYPFKDKERSVRFPIVGNAFQGAQNTTQIKFYFERMGNSSTTWVAVSKLPNGKIGSKVLNTYIDDEIGEPYALLELSSFYTQYEGSVYISLQGYQGGVLVEYDDEQDIYTIKGAPTIQASGSIKLAINYATQFVGSGEEENVTLQSLAALFGTKMNIHDSIFVVPSYQSIIDNIGNYDNGQIFYATDSKHFYKKANNGCENYDIVPFNQASVSVIIDTLTNINGRHFSNFTSERKKVDNYDVYHIKYGNNNTTEEQARNYMAYMTGSNYLPKYNFDRPANSYLLMASNGLLLKPQYDSTNGLLLYVMSQIVDANYLRENFGSAVNLSIVSNRNLVAKLLNANGVVISQSGVNLPSESIIVSATYIDFNNVELEKDDVGYVADLEDLTNDKYEQAIDQSTNVIARFHLTSGDVLELARVVYYPDSSTVVFGGKVGDTVYHAVIGNGADLRGQLYEWDEDLETNVQVPNGVEPHTLANFKYKDDYYNVLTAGDVVAPNYNETSTYVVGDIVAYGNNIYQCTTAVNIPEEFDSLKWSKGSIASLILGLINTGI